MTNLSLKVNFCVTIDLHMQTQQKYVKVAAKEGTLILIFITGQSFNEF